MRTTLSIDDDVLAAAKGLAARQHKSVGEVISALARQALLPSAPSGGVRNGIPLLPLHAQAAPVTSELVNRLRDELSTTQRIHGLPVRENKRGQPVR